MKKTALLFWILFIASSAFPQQKIELNLDKAIEIALLNNHDYKRVLLDFQKAEEQVREAYGSSLFPSIDGTLTYTRAIERARFIIETPFFSGSFPVGSQNTLTGTIYAEQPLFTGAMFLAVNIARTFAEISKKSAEYIESELIKNVKESYYTYLLANSLIRLAEVQLQRAEENRKNTKSMYDAGLAAEYDYIKANVQYQNIIPVLTETKNQNRLALNNLKLVLGLDLDSEVSIYDSLKYNEDEFSHRDLSVESLYEKNELIRQMELQVEMNDLIKSYQFTEHFPKLTAFGSWQTQAQEEDTRAFNDWRYFNAFSVGLTLKVPIFKGFTLDSKVEQAEVDFLKSQEVLSATKKLVRNEFDNIINDIAKTKEQISAYEATVDEAKRGYDIAVKRYNTGLGTQLEVTDALVAVTNAEINLLQSIHQYYVDQAKLDFITGK